MHKKIILCAAVALFSTSVFSSLTKIEDDFMQTVEDTNKNLANDIATRDARASVADAKELQAMFAQVEAFYDGKGDARDAVTLSRKSKDLSDEIIKLVVKNDFDAATEKATDLSRACKSCHNFYKKS